jgi:hypothetical protein
MSVYGFAPDDVWAGGTFGVGIHWDGSHWSSAPISPDGEHLQLLWGSDRTNLWAGGSALSPSSTGETDSFDGGVWTYHSTDCNGPITGIWGTGLNDVWFNCNDGTANLMHTAGGRVQRTTAIDSSLHTTAGMWGSAPNSYFAGAINNQLLHFDGGSWSVATTLPAAVQMIWGTSESDFWTVAGGQVFHFASPTDWTKQTLPMIGGFGIRALHGSSPTNVWGVGWPNTLVHYDGLSWSASPQATTQSPQPAFGAIWASGPNDLWALGDKTISHWDGNSWTLVEPALPQRLFAIQGAAPNDIWAIGGAFNMHYDGQSWTSQSAGLDGGIYAVWPMGNGEAYGADNARTVWHYTAATGWVPVHTLGTGLYTDGPYGLWASGPNDVWFGGGNDLAHWNGSTWTAAPGSGAPTHCAMIWGTGPNDVWNYFSNTAWHYNGTSWTHDPFLDSKYVHDVSVGGPNDIWLVDYYEIPWELVTADHWDGTHWTSIPIPFANWAAVATAGPHLVFAIGEQQVLYRQH